MHVRINTNAAMHAATFLLQTPALACVEMCQCIAQALPVSVRKGGGKGGDTLPPLLQLPGMTQEVLKKLRKRKINTLAGKEVVGVAGAGGGAGIACAI